MRDQDQQEQIPKTSDQEVKGKKIKKIIEISTEAAEERRLLSAFLLDKTEELTQERNKRKKQIESEKNRIKRRKNNL